MSTEKRLTFIDIKQWLQPPPLKQLLGPAQSRELSLSPEPAWQLSRHYRASSLLSSAQTLDAAYKVRLKSLDLKAPVMSAILKMHKTELLACEWMPHKPSSASLPSRNLIHRLASIGAHASLMGL